MSCAETECSVKIYAKKLCEKHYKRQLRVKERDSKPINEQKWKITTIKRRKKVFEKFNNCCKICGEKPDWTLKKINLQFHHLYYEGGRTEYIKEIDGPRNVSTRLLKEVEEYPERFELLCFECHKIVGVAKTKPHKIRACARYITNSSK